MLYNKICFLDIETTPHLAYIWGMFKENIPLDRLIKEREILSYSYAFGDEDPDTFTRLDFYSYKGFLENLRHALNEAEIVVGHNSNKFDIPTINAEIIKCGLNPPSPYRKIDTYLEARKNFKFASNKLEHLARALGVEEKIKHTGFELWVRCIQGDERAYEEMAEYNEQDVIVVREVYKKLRPWMQNHPNMNLYLPDVDGAHDNCPKCGSERINYRGYAHTAVGKYHRFVCLDCGGWGRNLVRENEKIQARNII